MNKSAILIFSFLLLSFFSMSAQEKTITGTVTSSEDGLGLPGVAVIVKGTTTGTITDFEGNYTLSFSYDSAVIVYSFVGMVTQEIPYTGTSAISIVMDPDMVGIEEVVITALGISKGKKAIGFAATSVSGSDISDAKVLNPMNALQGKVSGIDISTAPGPGGTQNVFIRGASSFGSNQPLYVIDGVPIINEQSRTGAGNADNADFGSGINAVNPDDIETMTVLKGAAATALYGSRAANGVILIKTKSGKNTEGKMNISYDGSYTITRIGRVPERQSIFGQGADGNHDLTENVNWGPAYTNLSRLYGYEIDNSQLIKSYSFVEDRVKDFFDLGTGMKHAVSMSGGNDMTTYFFSFSDNSVDGIYPGNVDTYDRKTISAKGSHNWEKLTVETSVNYANEKNRTVPTGGGNTVFQSLWQLPEDYSIVDMKDYNSKYWNVDNYFTYYNVNPYFSLNENGAEQKKNKIFGKIQFDYDILDNLKATYRFGGDMENSTNEIWVAKVEVSESAAGYDSFQGNHTEKNSPGSYEISFLKRYETNHEAFLTYNKEISDISLNALVGINVNERGMDLLRGKNNALDVPGYYHLANGINDAVAYQSGYGEPYIRRLYGIYSTVDLDYKRMYYATLTARNDRSSTLPKDNNSYFYPGFTGSAIVTEILNDQGIEIPYLDFMKVRAAYGWTGKDAEPYSVYPYYGKGFSENYGGSDIGYLTFPLNGVNSWTYGNQLGSPNLAPEITKELELGGDVYLFGNRMGIEFSYYNKLTEGLIYTQPLATSAGFDLVTSNIGDVRNKGIEIMVFATPVKINDFKWDVSVNYSQNRNKVERLNDTEVELAGISGSAGDYIGIYAIEGQELGVFKSNVAQTTTINGVEHRVVDSEGWPVMTPDEQILEGKSINEKYRLGFTTTLSYKGFSLGAVLDYRHGGYMYSGTKSVMMWTGSSVESTINNRNPFIIPNSVQLVNGQYVENTAPVSSDDIENFYKNGAMDMVSSSLIDRSYLKLREIRLSYELPQNVLDIVRLQSVKVSLAAGNFLLWTPQSNPYIDPEVTTYGNDVSAKFGEFGAHPTEQTFTFGLSAKF